MTMFARLHSFWHALWKRSEQEHDLDDEMRFHVEARTEDLIRGGLSREEAFRRARIEFGCLEAYQDRCRESRRVNWAEDLVQDVRFALRMLQKAPGFTVIAVLTLALGIGATVAIFAFVDAALIKPLPYANPNRLVGVTESIPLFPRANLSYPDYLDWKKLNTVFSSMDVWDGTGYLLATPSGTKTALGARVSDGFFRTLGVSPILGRDFVSGEDLLSAPRTVILSYAGWQNWFGGRAEAVGQTATLSGESYTIIGVLPKDFQFALRSEAEFWTTLHADGSCDLRRSCHGLDGIARLKEGVTVQMALANTKAIAAQLEKQYPDSNRGQGASVMPLSEVIVGDVRPILLVLFAGAALLLLIACVNVTSLLLVRSETRRREIAVRNALGASSTRLVRQFATEGLLLVLIGGALGLVAAEWAMQLLVRLIPAGMMADMPFLQGLGLNFHVVAFTCGISLLAAALFSFTPVSRLSLSEMREGLTEGSRGSAGTVWRRFGSHLVVVELATAMVLLVSAGLLGKSFYRLLQVDIGFQPDHLAVLFVAAPETTYSKDEQLAALGRQVVSRISNLPGVKSAAISNRVPLSGNGNTDWIRFVGKPFHGEHNEVNMRDVSPGYFTTLQAKLIRGRSFTDSEDASRPNVAVINQALAKHYFPGEDPIGKRIGDGDLTPKSIKEIIGIVDDIKEGPLDSEVMPTYYVPFAQSPDSFFGLLVRTSQAEQSMFLTLDATIHQIDPSLGIGGQSIMTKRINNSQTAYLRRSSAWLVGGFAALALLLGVLGLYGVIAYSVSQRTREIGVRMALGAQRNSVYQLILKEAAWLIGGGIVVGLVCSIAAATLVRGMLFGVQAWDIPTLSAVAAVLAASALVASYIPARRATKVDPVVALRHE
jgi:macrolide transport system ATP-binding/permease protein